jgi:hypothetical protein
MAPGGWALFARIPLFYSISSIEKKFQNGDWFGHLDCGHGERIGHWARCPVHRPASDRLRSSDAGEIPISE